jgi:hypothetical protein
MIVRLSLGCAARTSLAISSALLTQTGLAVCAMDRIPVGKCSFANLQTQRTGRRIKKSVTAARRLDFA